MGLRPTGEGIFSRVGPNNNGVFMRKGKWKDPLANAMRLLEATPTDPSGFDDYFDLAALESRQEAKVVEKPVVPEKPDPRVKKRRRKRHFSPKKDRPPCPACGVKHWLIVDDHATYRDPFLECGSCHESFRTDLSPLDFRYAWRDGIEMPKEVKQKHTGPLNEEPE